MTEDRENQKVETPVDHNFHMERSDALERWKKTRPAGYAEYRRRWETSPVERKAGQHPVHLDVEATSACNLKCVMCPRTEMVAQGRFWKVESFDFDAYVRILEQGVPLGLCSVKFNYLGEPLLNKRLPEMIRAAKSAGVLDVMLNTNAVLLDLKVGAELIESGLDQLFFSVDSPNPEHFEAIRPGARFDRVVGNIRGFGELRDRMKRSSPFTRMSMVLMKENRDEWPRFKELFAPLVDAVAYVDYLDHGDQHNPDRTVVPVGSRRAKFCCPQLWQRSFLHPDGVATVCCLDSNRELAVGNWKEQTMAEIWTNEPYERLRRLHAAGRFEEIPACARCPLARY